MTTGYHLLDNPRVGPTKWYSSRRNPIQGVVIHITAGLQDLDGGRETLVGGNGIRIKAGVSPSGVYVDRAVASGVDYEYRATAHGNNGTTRDGAWTGASVAQAIDEYGGY